jgi:hypothetical protein
VKKRASLVVLLALCGATAMFLTSPGPRFPNENTALHVGKEVVPDQAESEQLAYVPLAPTSIAASLRDNAQAVVN